MNAAVVHSVVILSEDAVREAGGIEVEDSLHLEREPTATQL